MEVHLRSGEAADDTVGIRQQVEADEGHAQLQRQDEDHLNDRLRGAARQQRAKARERAKEHVDADHNQPVARSERRRAVDAEEEEALDAL
jgi:hypothetical protein